MGESLQGVQVGGSGKVAGGAHGQLSGGKPLGGSLHVSHRYPVHQLLHLARLHHVSSQENLQQKSGYRKERLTVCLASKRLKITGISHLPYLLLGCAYF